MGGAREDERILCGGEWVGMGEKEGEWKYVKREGRRGRGKG